MATFDDLKLLIETIADSRSGAGTYGLRTPGTIIELERNVEIETGKSWGNDKAFQILLEGLAQYFDDSGIGGIAIIKTKLNELIGEYNQLRLDYDAGVVPTTAEEVDPIP